MPERKDIAIAARVPIYGTKDAGRQFYKKFRKTAIAAGFTECKSLGSLYYFEVDGQLKALLGAHVDDLMWCCCEGYEYLMDDVLSHFDLKKIDEGKFRFCGREYIQEEDFSVSVN